MCAQYASSSSGGDSSCEEGASHRPPHLRPFHPRTVALDPDAPPLLSSDPDYSSSSEQSCDTVIYVGPGGVAVSDRELSDNEGPPSFVPIIPSLNKKRVKDAPQRSDGDHFKCNTFAELQERLDCIDGSEGPAALAAEGKEAQAAAARTGAAKPTEVTSSPKSDKRVLESTAAARAGKPDQDRVPAGNSTLTLQEKSALSPAAGVRDASQRTSADGEKLSAPASQAGGKKPSGTRSPDAERVVREKIYLKEKPSASPSSSPKASRAPPPAEAAARAPPVGMSHQAARHGQAEPADLRAALFGRDFLRTTVTLQQPVGLNGEDELVFTVVEELPRCLVPDNGRPPALSFGGDFPLQGFSSDSRPVSIISSINDEYDAYTSQRGAAADPAEREGTRSTGRLPTSPSVFRKQPFLQHGIKSSLNDSGVCFSELDSDPATPNKTKCPPSPDSTKAALKGSLRARANTMSSSLSAQIPHRDSHSSLPRKTKPTSSAGEGRHGEASLQGISHLDPREVELLSAGKPPKSGVAGASSKRPNGSSNSVPRPPKAQASSAGQRVVDGCERSGGRRGDAAVKLPRLTRGATTLGTVSTPHSAEATPGSGSLRFASLGKKATGQKSGTISKSGSGSVSPSALKVSGDIGKSSFSKTSTLEEELAARLRADSFSHRTSSLKTDHGPARTSSSLKARGAKADPSKQYGSLLSLERSDGSRSEVSSSSRSNRLVPRLGVPASTSASASSAQVSSGIFELTTGFLQVTASLIQCFLVFPF